MGKVEVPKDGDSLYHTLAAAFTNATMQGAVDLDRTNADHLVMPRPLEQAAQNRALNVPTLRRIVQSGASALCLREANGDEVQARELAKGVAAKSEPGVWGEHNALAVLSGRVGFCCGLYDETSGVVHPVGDCSLSLLSLMRV